MIAGVALSTFSNVALAQSEIQPGQRVRYTGPFTNTTYTLSGNVVIEVVIEPQNRISGYINFTNDPGVRTLCGAGNFTGIRQGRTFRFNFVSSDPDPGCGFDRGLKFTVSATLSPDNSTLESGSYQINNTQAGIFTANSSRNQSPAQRLKEAAIEAAKAYPNDCKFSVADASKRMNINPPLPAILADKQIAYIQQKWKKVSIKQAMNLARQGVFVVATATSSELQSTNGHVAVISPSKGITFPDRIEYPLVIGGALNQAASSIRSKHASNGEISIRYAFPKTLVVNGTVTYWTP